MSRVCSRSYGEIIELHPTCLGHSVCVSLHSWEKSQGDSEGLEQRRVWGRGSGGEGPRATAVARGTLPASAGPSGGDFTLQKCLNQENDSVGRGLERRLLSAGEAGPETAAWDQMGYLARIWARSQVSGLTHCSGILGCAASKRLHRRPESRSVGSFGA